MADNHRSRRVARAFLKLLLLRAEAARLRRHPSSLDTGGAEEKMWHRAATRQST